MLHDNPNKFGWRKQLRTFSLSIRTLCSQRFQLQFCLCFCLMIVVIVVAVFKTLSYSEALALSLENRAAALGSRFVSKTATSFTSKLRNTTQIFSPLFSMMQNRNASQSTIPSTVSPNIVSATTITVAQTAVKVEVPFHDGFRITLPAEALQAAEHAAEEGGESASDLADAYAELKTPAQRLAAIRQEVEHAWNGYESYAFGHDEIRPVSNITNDSWGGFGATLIDALDTLILLGLDEQVARARAHVEKINFDKKVDMSFFETTIRYLGGLLGAYELSRDELYLTQAKSLGDRLVKSFDGTPSGLPQSVINLHTLESHNLQWTGRASILAEVGSCQLEFGQLSRLLKDPSYYDRSKKVYERLTHMSQMHDLKGLYPSYLNIQQSKPHPMRSRISLGGLSDSFYEYLLKVYLFDPSFALPLQMYIESTDSIQQKMLTRVPDHAPRLPEHQGRQWLFTNELNEDGHPSLQQDHLCCFAGGLFTLGALEVQRAERENAVLPSVYELSTRAEKHRQIGKELTETCVELYEEQPTGLGPEIVAYGNVKPVGHERWKAHSTKYILRPETLEAIFYQYRATGDPIWRERGWRIFLNLVRHCRTPIAYSGVLDVRQNPAKQNDSQQSFLFAETFKYLWLLFADPNVLSLDQYVFSTEAHPFRRAH